MLKLKLQYFGHLMQSWLIGKDSDAGRDWGQKKGTTEDEMSGWHHQLNGCESEWTPGVGDGQGALAWCNFWGCKESDTNEQLNWTELMTSDVEHLFKYLLVFQISSVEKYLFRSFAYLSIKLGFFYYWTLWFLYIFGRLNSHKIYCLIFSPPHRLSFHFADFFCYVETS